MASNNSARGVISSHRMHFSMVCIFNEKSVSAQIVFEGMILALSMELDGTAAHFFFVTCPLLSGNFQVMKRGIRRPWRSIYGPDFHLVLKKDEVGDEERWHRHTSVNTELSQIIMSIIYCWVINLPHTQKCQTTSKYFVWPIFRWAGYLLT